MHPAPFLPNPALPVNNQFLILRTVILQHTDYYTENIFIPTLDKCFGRCIFAATLKHCAMKNEIVFFDPLSDFGFKRIFASESNKDLLIDFLNACLSHDVGTITDLTLLPNEHPGVSPQEKRVVFDIHCRNADGKFFIIEMQRARQHFFAERVITYVSRVVSRQAEKGARRYEIPYIYSFNILDYRASEFGNCGNFFHKVQLKNEHNEIFSDKTTYYFVELPKFAAVKEKGSEGSSMHKWLELLTSIAGSTDQDYGATEGGVFRKLIEECKISKLSNMEREEYEKSIFEYEDVRDAIACAREDGVEEGFERGIEKGLKQGLEQGKQQLVLNMLVEGIELETIVRISGLTHEEILAMQRQ